MFGSAIVHNFFHLVDDGHSSYCRLVMVQLAVHNDVHVRLVYLDSLPYLTLQGPLELLKKAQLEPDLLLLPLGEVVSMVHKSIILVLVCVFKGGKMLFSSYIYTPGCFSIVSGLGANNSFCSHLVLVDCRDPVASMSRNHID